MRINKLYIILGMLIALGMFFELAAHADEANEATTITFSAPVQIPGRVRSSRFSLSVALDSDTDKREPKKERLTIGAVTSFVSQPALEKHNGKKRECPTQLPQIPSAARSVTYHSSYTGLPSSRQNVSGTNIVPVVDHVFHEVEKKALDARSTNNDQLIWIDPGKNALIVFKERFAGGERDAQKLARFRDARCKTEQEIAEQLSGRANACFNSGFDRLNTSRANQ